MHNYRLLSVILAVILLFILPGRPQYVHAGTFTDCASVAQIPVAECNALVAVYNSTHGASWTNHTNWLVTDTPGDWFGVTVASEHVTGIVLGNNQLSGSIPAQLGSLANLQDLILSSNHLTGSIPTQLGSLAKLGRLELDDNHLSGSIPPELGNLAKLQDLYLGYNQLSGSIPTQLGSLTDLNLLNLSGNQLSGSLPTQLGNLTKLQYLELDTNQLSGSIPLSFTALIQLGSFNATATWLCEPQDAAFQTWKSTVTTWSSPGLCYATSGRVTRGADPLAGVTISTGVYSAASGQDGVYTLLMLPGDYTLTPALAGYSFSPPTRSVTLTNANLTGKDFSAILKVFMPLILRQ